MRRLHPERADQLKFHRDDPIDRHRNFALLSRGGESDLHMTSLLAETHDRVAAGGRDSERVDGDVGAAAGEIHDRGDRVGLLRIDDVIRAHALGEFEFRRVQVDADHIGSHSGRDVYRR